MRATSSDTCLPARPPGHLGHQACPAILGYLLGGAKASDKPRLNKDPLDNVNIMIGGAFSVKVLNGPSIVAILAACPPGALTGATTSATVASWIRAS